MKIILFILLLIIIGIVFKNCFKKVSFFYEKKYKYKNNYKEILDIQSDFHFIYEKIYNTKKELIINNTRKKVTNTIFLIVSIILIIVCLVYIGINISNMKLLIIISILLIVGTIILSIFVKKILSTRKNEKIYVREIVLEIMNNWHEDYVFYYNDKVYEEDKSINKNINVLGLFEIELEDNRKESIYKVMFPRLIDLIKEYSIRFKIYDKQINLDLILVNSFSMKRNTTNSNIDVYRGMCAQVPLNNKEINKSICKIGNNLLIDNNKSNIEDLNINNTRIKKIVFDFINKCNIDFEIHVVNEKIFFKFYYEPFVSIDLIKNEDIELKIYNECCILENISKLIYDISNLDEV